MANARSVLVTGGCGYIGAQLVRRLAAVPGIRVVAFDLRPPAESAREGGVDYVQGDIRGAEVEAALRAHAVDTVVHLASIVTPTPQMTREFIHSVDVLGTQNVVEASLRAGVRQLIVTSSGAAYGYYADNPVPLKESDAIRGNPEFAYSDHKRQVEEFLARVRAEHPALRQLVLRLCTVIGATTDNQITALLKKRFVLGITGASTPFVFVWDQDVVACLLRGILEEREGIYNLAGDGTLTMRAIARRIRKPYVALPAWLLRGALALLHPLGLSQYGPEQVGFLQYRPVLDNAKIKAEFGFVPEKSSAEALEYYLANGVR